MSSTVMTLVLVVTLGIFAWSASRRWRLILVTRPDPRITLDRDSLAKRFANVLMIAGLQKKMPANERYRLEGIAHIAIFAAFNVLLLSIDMLVLLIAVIGGRVIPFFTERALPGAHPQMWRPVEWVSIGAVAALAVLRAMPFASELTLALAAVAALVHAVRLWGWSDRRLWSVPLLWILYAGYGWVVIGFALEALAVGAVIRPQLAVHAFITGAIGALTLGMMARVAIGDTGRPLRAAPPVVAAFVLVNVAALLRVFGAWWLPGEWYLSMVVAAGVAWVSTFVLFFSVYAPILTRPRTDALEG
jgi:uncharacterized protein involved in response to NO